MLDWVTHLMTKMPSEFLALPVPATDSMSGACRHYTSRATSALHLMPRWLLRHHRYSPQGERGLGFDAGQLVWVADVVEAGDAGVLDTDRHDAVDLAVQA
jgi:hypothetical protein